MLGAWLALGLVAVQWEDRAWNGQRSTRMAGRSISRCSLTEATDAEVSIWSIWSTCCSWSPKVACEEGWGASKMLEHP